MRHIALPQPGDWRQFCILASRLHARPVDLRRPVWEMYVIEGLDNVSFLPAGAFAVLVKVHHMALDDVTEDDFTVALHDRHPKTEAAASAQRWFSEQQPGATQLLWLAWFNNTIKLLETGQTVLDKLPFVGSKTLDAGDVLRFGDTPAPETRFDRRISPHRVWDACFVAQSDVDQAKEAVPGATFDDVILTIVGGGMRRYLAAKGELPAESLYALVPMHVHHKDDEGIPGHRIQLVRGRLMSHIADPVERLAAIREERAEADKLDRVKANELNEMRDVLPSTAMNLAAKAIGASLGPGRSFRENHNTVVSMVPGPPEPVYLCGARLLAITGMAAITDRLALSHTVTTYDGRVAIAPVCDRHAMPDPAFYAQCLEAAADALARGTSQDG